MKLLLMADNQVGREITRWLVNHYPEDLALIVSVADNEILAIARDAGLPCIEFGSNEEVDNNLRLRNLTPDLGLLVWWPKIVKAPLLNAPKRGFINTHPSFLPHNRGKHYNFWAIVEGVPFGVSLHFVNDGIDTGDIIVQKRVPYDWEDTGGSLYVKASEAMIEIVKEAYPTIRQETIPRFKQNLEEGSFHLARELDPASRIDLQKTYTARALLNLLRARTFPGHPACCFNEGDETFEVRVEIKRKNA